MNPDIEIFLQEAFKLIEASVAGAGRVVVEPDYESSAPLTGADRLRTSMSALLAEQKPAIAALASHEGFVADGLDQYGDLKLLIRRITLHADAAEGPWIEVTPPGNWI